MSTDNASNKDVNAVEGPVCCGTAADCRSERVTYEAYFLASSTQSDLHLICIHDIALDYGAAMQHLSKAKSSTS